MCDKKKVRYNKWTAIECDVIKQKKDLNKIHHKQNLQQYIEYVRKHRLTQKADTLSNDGIWKGMGGTLITELVGITGNSLSKA